MKQRLLDLLECFITAILFWIIAPFATYFLPCGGEYEQAWLNAEIAYLKQLHRQCDDPELKEILAYTIKRYNRIGTWGVAIIDCWDKDLHVNVLGVNIPWCPGITIDPMVLNLSIEEGAEILVHEALHDRFPYFGHSQHEKICPQLCKLTGLRRPGSGHPDRKETSCVAIRLPESPGREG